MEGVEGIWDELAARGCLNHLDQQGSPHFAVYFTSQVVLVVKNPPANAGDTGDMSSVPGLGRSPGGGHGSPLQYSCLENLTNREAWRATIHRAVKSWM